MRIDAPLPLATSAPPSPPPGANLSRLRAAAEELEATFLAEMLKSAGLGQMPSEFGGGAGEEHFASLLRTEQARAMVAGGGIGLAEHIFRSLAEQADG
ncbi:rod-binding protein [Pseudoroseicyclus tamaricis]|uniref:Chemotaxis protein chel n=1 Tax=Pseudoroseicyclus tamaricis TaxID=2705421 RepID=A0A6B2K203_9RHOB|nr:rod-binding protein [Pseudoroseicyclus tamaricis]NDV02544.1 chemotaxis protein chel [Pseudoroseicyclus tamaricis]